MSADRKQAVLNQIQNAKEKAFREVIQAAAGNMAADAADSTKDIRQSVVDFQMILHSAFREFIEKENSFFEAPFEYHAQWLRAYKPFCEHTMYPIHNKRLIDIGVPWSHGELIMVGSYNPSLLDIIPLRMAAYEAEECFAPVAYISLDREWKTLRDQILADEAELPIEKITKPSSLNTTQSMSLEFALCSLSGTPLYLTRLSFNSIFDLAMELRTWAQDIGPGIVFIENIRCMDGLDDEPVVEGPRLLECTCQLKALAMELDIAIVIGADLPVDVCDVPEEGTNAYRTWEINLERYAQYADHVLLMSPSAICCLDHLLVDGEMVIAKCRGSFLRKVVYL